MKAFRRRDGVLAARVDADELGLLASLVEQVAELLGDGPDAAPEDPFARWASEFGGSEALDHSDPIVRRLFPDAYADAAASAEYRALTEDALRRGRLEAAHIVLADLEAVEGTSLRVPDAHVDAWLRTVNAVRLSLAARLGIETEDDHDALSALPRKDARRYVLDVYDWLGWILESLLEAFSC